MTVPTLSTINPDFNDIANQLRQNLVNKSSWRALLEVETGSILLESMAAVGTMLMTSIQNAVEENHPDTARLDSSLKAMARTLGVRLQRKTPAVATVNLTIPAQATTYIIPAYSQFSAAGRKLFNRQAILFNPNTTIQSVTLHEGLVQTASFTGNGAPAQLYYLDVPGFTVSDRDVLVFVDNLPVKVVTDGLWHYPNPSGLVTEATKVVQDRTLPTGELELLFGSDLFGFQPPGSSIVNVLYVLTNGAAGNDVGFPGQNVTLDSDSNVKGVATTVLNNGADEPPAESYRNSPLVYASYGRAVSISDHEALTLKYGNIADARYFGQQLIAPNVKEYMNVVYVYLLQQDGTQMNETEFAEFLAWLQPKAMPLEYVSKAAVPIPVTINVDVFIRNTGDAPSVRASVLTAINALFKPVPGYLGRNLHLSDLYDAIKDADQAIDYIQLKSPSSDTICRVDSPQITSLSASNVGGSVLSPGTVYTYSVAALNTQGETFSSRIVQINMPSGSNTATVNWSAVPGATGYRLYGRVNTDMRQLGSDLSASTLSFVDTGNVSLGSTINLVNTSGLFYASLNSAAVNVLYTTRR